MQPRTIEKANCNCFYKFYQQRLLDVQIPPLESPAGVGMFHHTPGTNTWRYTPDSNFPRHASSIFRIDRHERLRKSPENDDVVVGRNEQFARNDDRYPVACVFFDTLGRDTRRHYSAVPLLCPCTALGSRVLFFGLRHNADCRGKKKNRLSIAASWLSWWHQNRQWFGWIYTLWGEPFIS